MGIGSLVDLVSLELSVGGVQIGDIVARLTDEPDAALLVEIWIARPGLLPRDCPLHDLNRRHNRRSGRKEKKREGG
jgi:hypothetical protein